MMREYKNSSDSKPASGGGGGGGENVKRSVIVIPISSDAQLSSLDVYSALAITCQLINIEIRLIEIRLFDSPRGIPFFFFKERIDRACIKYLPKRDRREGRVSFFFLSINIPASFKPRDV